MAAESCSTVRLFLVTEEAFYFEEAEDCTDLEEDALQKSVLPVEQYFIVSKDNKFLIYCSEDGFEMKNLNTQQSQSGNRYNFQIYKNTEGGGKGGRSVMLYAEKNGKKIMVCCNDKREIHPVEMDLPLNISSSAHRAVFNRRKLADSRYSLESSIYPNTFLAFEPDEKKSGVSKLVLRYKGRDDVDDSTEFFLRS